MWQNLVDTFLYTTLGLDATSPLIQALNFFIYDSVKITLLMAIIIFVASFIRSYFNTEKARLYLANKHPLVGHVLAALLGIVTPFCSCSAVPLFVGFLQARIPLGVAFSFIISAPMNNEIAIGLLFALFGLKVTLLYIGLGLLVAIVGGFIIGQLHAEKWVLINPFWTPAKPSCATSTQTVSTFTSRLISAKDATRDLLRSVVLWVFLGVGIGAIIHGFIPTDLVAMLAGKENPFAVILAVLLGIPMYANCAGAMPLVLPLLDKGMAMGTALAFMMSVTALSLPEAIILKKILHIKLIALFFGIVGVGIISVGYIFNGVLG